MLKSYRVWLWVGGGVVAHKILLSAPVPIDPLHFGIGNGIGPRGTEIGTRA